MKRTEKESFVEEFRERLQESPAIFLTDFTGSGREVHDRPPG